MPLFKRPALSDDRPAPSDRALTARRAQRRRDDAFARRFGTASIR